MSGPCSCLTLALQVPDDEHVICALSGGVDSAVAATLVHKARRPLCLGSPAAKGSRKRMAGNQGTGRAEGGNVKRAECRGR